MILKLSLILLTGMKAQERHCRRFKAKLNNVIHRIID